jgi:Protein of unknown function (DUF3592)
MNEDTKFLRIFGLGFFVFGSIFLIIGIAFGLSYYHFISKTITTQGTVIDLEKGSSSTDEGIIIVYYPIIKFNTLSGEPVVFTSQTGKNRAELTVGQQIQVLYNPQEPNNARVDQFSVELFLSVIFISIGSIFAFIGGIVIVQSFKPHPFSR